jgi:hypothetical protein
MVCLVKQRQDNRVLKRAAAVFLLLAMNAYGEEKTLDYDFDFESGKFNLNCSGNCPVISDKYSRSGRYAMESTISDSSANVRRTEAVIPGKEKLMEYDRDYWIGFSIYLPEGWRAPHAMEILAQIHRKPDPGVTNTQPPFALYSGSGLWKVTSQGWGDKEDWFLNCIYDDVGRWVDFVVHYKPSFTSTGVLQVWKDGALVADRKGPNTAEDRLGPYFKLGIYKGRYKAPEKTVYHDNFRVASGPDVGYSDVASSEAGPVSHSVTEAGGDAVKAGDAGRACQPRETGG